METCNIETGKIETNLQRTSEEHAKAAKNELVPPTEQEYVDSPTIVLLSEATDSWQQKVERARVMIESLKTDLDKRKDEIVELEGSRKDLNLVKRAMGPYLPEDEDTLLLLGPERYSSPAEADKVWSEIEKERRDVDIKLDMTQENIDNVLSIVKETLDDDTYEECIPEIRLRMKENLRTFLKDAKDYIHDITQHLESIQSEKENRDAKNDAIVQSLWERYEVLERKLEKLGDVSRIPEIMSGPWTGWSGHHFIKVDIPSNLKKKDYVQNVLRVLVREMVESEKETIPQDPVDLLRLVASRTLGHHQRMFTILNLQKDVEYVEVAKIHDFSGGEQITAAILLFMSLSTLMAQNGNEWQRTGSLLILDNPIGSANLASFIELQRTIARYCNIQLLYTTGLNDQQALGAFSKVVKFVRRFRDKNGKNQYVSVLPKHELPMDTASISILQAKRVKGETNLA